MDPVPTTQAAGQISADGQFRWDGQQWVPLASNYREPTPWTRPMQLITAALFAISAISGVVTTIAFVNHDSVLRAIHAQGTQVPAGTDIDTVVNVTIGITYGVAIFFSLLYLVAALGSYLGWRWMFWAALVLYGLSGITVFTNIGSFANPDRSPIPVTGLIVSELFAVLGLAMFVWMLIAAIRYGPWAMKKPGR
ncbi:MAG: hypothetical protein E6I23_11245 [Chloroflexi bacterium]|nr:MAG: hypothetical protein AUH32_02615 [Actinobacteria bacterium 13_1_40CM_66_12]TMF43130.1 MAG: hypothetical protein E6I23_11245 [Chloroflexota bacterium]